jgi:hypothetical protein
VQGPSKSLPENNLRKKKVTTVTKRKRTPPVQRGDPCPSCSEGFLECYKSKRSSLGDWVKRYLRCPECGSTALEVVPAADVPHRAPRTKERRAKVNPPKWDCLPRGKMRPAPRTLQETSAVDELITIDALAARCGIPRHEVVKWIANGLCPTPGVVGHYARWAPSTINAMH